MSPMAYVRARRLSDAARALIAGAPDILRLALDSGYASHEAFSRAFKSQFGLERYKPAFDPRTGDGGVEVWVALSP